MYSGFDMFFKAAVLVVALVVTEVDGDPLRPHIIFPAVEFMRLLGENFLWRTVSFNINKMSDLRVSKQRIEVQFKDAMSVS